MKLLLTNDDGIDAEGLQALLEAAKQLGDPWLIGPAGHQSGCSHAVTTGEKRDIEKINHPLRTHACPLPPKPSIPVPPPQG